MKIYYQWDPGSYSHLAAKNIRTKLSQSIDDIEGLEDFDSVWDAVSQGNVGVLPLENSYAWTIHQNVYNFLLYSHQIIGEYDFEVEHCLLSLEDSKDAIEEVYSHHQALSQTHKYTRKNGWIAKPFGDTAGAAKMLTEKQKYKSAAIASALAAEIYGLNVLDTHIQDQDGNTTKFLVIIPKEQVGKLTFSEKKRRISLFFEAGHSAGSLYKALWVLAKRGINLTKIESIPLRNQRFTYGFWIRFEGTLSESIVIEAMEELKNYVKDIRVFGEY